MRSCRSHVGNCRKSTRSTGSECVVPLMGRAPWFAAVAARSPTILPAWRATRVCWPQKGRDFALPAIRFDRRPLIGRSALPQEKRLTERTGAAEVRALTGDVDRNVAASKRSRETYRVSAGVAHVALRVVMRATEMM